MKKQIAFFGGTSGLGTQVIEYLKDYDVDSVGSAKVNLLNEVEIDGYFKNNTPVTVSNLKR